MCGYVPQEMLTSVDSIGAFLISIPDFHSCTSSGKIYYNIIITMYISHLLYFTHLSPQGALHHCIPTGAY